MVLDIFLYFFKGILTGIVLGMPVGVIGILTMQRALFYGKRAGLISGLGSSVADLIYGIVGCFGLKIFSGFIEKYQMIITLIGAIVIIIIGINLIIKKADSVEEYSGSENRFKIFSSSFLIGITNPVIVVTFMFAFYVCGIASNISLIKGIVMLSGMFVGTCIWWFIIILIVNIFKDKLLKLGINKINIVLGIAVILLGILLIGKSFTTMNPHNGKKTDLWIRENYHEGVYNKHNNFIKEHNKKH
jgi:hypothetical protein